MAWSFEEAVSYYQKLGAPRDQTALISLLREIQMENGGSIPEYILSEIAKVYHIKENFLTAIIRRIPSLRLCNTHCLEICAGPNCGKHHALAAYAERLHANAGKTFILRFVPCMRMCGKGPNLKLDGTLYHGADETLLMKLMKEAGFDFDSQP